VTAHYQNPYLPHSHRAPAAPKARRGDQIIETDRDGLPIGTAVQVMTWVGEDPDRAARYLAKEQAESRPRVSLVANLTTVIKKYSTPEVVEAPVVAEPTSTEVVAVAEEVDPLAMIRERLQVD
jgi:hypothetical protein